MTFRLPTENNASLFYIFFTKAIFRPFSSALPQAVCVFHCPCLITGCQWHNPSWRRHPVAVHDWVWQLPL